MKFFQKIFGHPYKFFDPNPLKHVKKVDFSFPGSPLKELDRHRSQMIDDYSTIYIENLVKSVAREIKKVLLKPETFASDDSFGKKIEKCLKIGVII